MRFELLPVIDTMLTLYQMPAGPERFNAYLAILQGSTPGSYRGGLEVPVGNYNPMGKPAYIEKLRALKYLDAEGITQNTLNGFNRTVNQRFNLGDDIVKVCLGLADDVKGGWTNRYTTDYDSKFKLGPMLKRNFCLPVF